MKARPILFSAQMIRALLAGTKTQTWCVVKPQPVDHDFGHGFVLPALTGRHVCEGLVAVGCNVAKDYMGYVNCPCGAPGDLLWVRERHALYATHGQRREDGQRWGPWGGLPTAISPDGKQIAYYREGFDRCDPGQWRPSIHMPRWASRLTLRLNDVRVQRLQEISEADAIAEGVLCSERDPRGGEWPEFPASYAEGYHWLWESINGAGSWDANPWVWALNFEVIQQNVDAVLASRAAT